MPMPRRGDVAQCVAATVTENWQTDFPRFVYFYVPKIHTIFYYEILHISLLNAVFRNHFAVNFSLDFLRLFCSNWSTVGNTK